MRIRNKWLTKIGGLGIAAAARALMSTLDYRIAYYDPTADPIHPEFQGRAIFLFWHDSILLPFYLRAHCQIAMLLSKHQDADWLLAAARHAGFHGVRGSTNRGGAQAIRELMEKSRLMSLAITPDGPRGPRRQLAPGCIYLSSRLQLPIIGAGIGYDRPWHLSTWDRFMLPRPYSRARVVVSPKLHLPPDLDRQGIEEYRRRVEAVMTHVTREAEHWAQTGKRVSEQMPLQRQARPLHFKQRAAA